MNIKAVIVQAHGEYKVGDRIEVSAEDFAVLASENMAVTEAQFKAEEAVRAQEQRTVKAREAKIDNTITACTSAGRFLPKEDTTAVRATALAIEANAEGAGVAYLNSLPIKAKDKLDGRQTTSTEGGTTQELTVQGQGIRENIKAYCKLSKAFEVTATSGGIVRAANGNQTSMNEAASISKERSLILREINQAIQAGGDFRMADVVKAADYADPAAGNSLGVLNTGLQLSWNLGFLSNQLAPIADITTDISNQPALFGQVLRTRYITVPGVQAKTNLTAWSGKTGNSTDVNVSINNYVGVPITIGENVIGSTIRNLHMEQKTPQMYGLGEYLIYQLINTAINGSTRIANDGTSTSTVKFTGKGDGKTAGAKFVPSGGAYTLSAFTGGLPLVMDLSKFPGGDEGPGTPLQRFAWVHSSIYANIASDANLLLTQTIQSAVAKGGSDNLVATGLIPQLGNLKIRKSQLMTDTNTLITDPGNSASQVVSVGDYTAATVRGIAGTRSSLLFASRVPTDYTKIMPEIPTTAAIELVTEPNTGLTFMVVKYLDHSLETSNLRVALMFGIGVGDERQAFLMS